MINPTDSYAQAHAGADGTEMAAQERVAPIAGVLRDRVLHLVAAAENGLTATEAYEQYVEEFGEPSGGLYSIAPRLSELERRGGYVCKSGESRGRRAAYVVTDAGRNWVAGGAA